MVIDLNIEHLLDPSHTISLKEKSRLAELKEEYPWSEIIQIAHLKSLKDSNDLRFSEELKNVSLVSQDRARLYKYLYSADLQITIDKVEKEMAELPEVEGLISPDWEKSKHSFQAETAQIEDIKEVEVDIPAIKIDAAIENESAAEANLLEESVDNSSLLDQTENDNKSNETASISESRDENIIAKQGDKQKTLESISPESEQLNHLIISEAIDTSITLDVMEDIASKKTVSSDSYPELPSTPTDSPSVSSDDFINWLVSNAASVQYPSFDQQSTQPFNKSVDSIVDRFIQNEPQISRGKSKEFGTENLAKDSLVDNEEFVTETLAEIYASQGNISKAKRAFQLLSLKYPEKSIYFAARIKRLGRKK